MRPDAFTSRTMSELLGPSGLATRATHTLATRRPYLTTFPEMGSFLHAWPPGAAHCGAMKRLILVLLATILSSSPVDAGNAPVNGDLARGTRLTEWLCPR